VRRGAFFTGPGRKAVGPAGRTQRLCHRLPGAVPGSRQSGFDRRPTGRGRGR